MATKARLRRAITKEQLRAATERLQTFWDVEAAYRLGRREVDVLRLRASLEERVAYWSRLASRVRGRA